MEGTAIERPTVIEATSNGAGGMPASAVNAKLYGVPGSAPTFSAELMLMHKGIQYRRVNLIGGLHRRRLRSKGFPGITVPALVLNGELVQTNRAIARALDQVVPDPALFPRSPAGFAEVDEAERFADEILQPAVRRIVIWSLGHDPDSVRSHPDNGRLMIPRSAWLRALMMPRVYRMWKIDEAIVRADLEQLPHTLDRLDRYIAEGILDNPRLTAADFETAPLIAALMGVADLGAEIGSRPVGAHAARVMPSWARTYH
jgi:glutathione S-transferase